MRLSPFLLPLCAVLLLPTNDARAWNYTGHRTIATIAYDELKPEVRAKVDALLKAHPRYDKDLLGEISPDYTDHARFAFAMSGFWPDIVRNPNNPMHFTSHHPQWHYIEYAFKLPDWKPATAPSTGPATQPAVEGPKNVVEAILKSAADLRDPSLNDEKKAVALCWLVHTVGDIHQPLHATTLFSAQFPDGDQGGNRFIVSVRRQNMNLHAVWDEMLGMQSSQSMIDYIAAGIRNDPKLRREALPEVAEQNPDVWKKESHDLGERVAYRNGTLQGASSEDIRRDPTMFVPSLPEGYVRDGEVVAARRAALAGHRLADLLNATLSN
jgi:hypothetical protein